MVADARRHGGGSWQSPGREGSPQPPWFSAGGPAPAHGRGKGALS